MKLVTVLSILLFILPAESEEYYSPKLDVFMTEYKEIKLSHETNQIKANRLAKLDFKLRAFLKQVDPDKSQLKHWNKEYFEELGVYLGHWADDYIYNGKILEQAHNLDSEHLREYMLFAEMHTGKYCWVEDRNNLVAGLKYTEEYSDGPYIADVYYNLGGFYWSLYNYLSSVETGGREKEVVSEHQYFFKQYIESNDYSLSEYKSVVKNRSIRFWNMYLERDRFNAKFVRDMLKEMKEGSDTSYGAFSCSD